MQILVLNLCSFTFQIKLSAVHHGLLNGMSLPWKWTMKGLGKVKLDYYEKKEKRKKLQNKQTNKQNSIPTWQELKKEIILQDRKESE